MKTKLLLIILIPLLLLSYSFSSYAHSTNSPARRYVGNGYTQEGIYYEVYDILSNGSFITTCDVSQYVERVIIYYQTITPPNTLPCQQTINGTYYAGTLSLYKYQWKSNQTHAFYKGYIYSSN